MGITEVSINITLVMGITAITNRTIIIVGISIRNDIITTAAAGTTGGHFTGAPTMAGLIITTGAIKVKRSGGR